MHKVRCAATHASAWRRCLDVRRGTRRERGAGGIGAPKRAKKREGEGF